MMIFAPLGASGPIGSHRMLLGIRYCGLFNFGLGSSFRPPAFNPEPIMDQDVTKLLNEWNAGDPDAMGKVAAELSGELRKLAASYMKGERENHTLQPTALVNELYLKLAQREQVAWTDRSHFFAFAARTLRRILVDHARKHRAEKRGGSESHVSLEDSMALLEEQDVDILDLNRALEALAKDDERLSSVVEMRFFAGLTIEETAAVLKIGTATVKRDLKIARAYLKNRLKHQDPESDDEA